MHHQTDIKTSNSRLALPGINYRTTLHWQNQLHIDGYCTRTIIWSPQQMLHRPRHTYPQWIAASLKCTLAQVSMQSSGLVAVWSFTWTPGSRKVNSGRPNVRVKKQRNLSTWQRKEFSIKYLCCKIRTPAINQNGRSESKIWNPWFWFNIEIHQWLSQLAPQHSTMTIKPQTNAVVVSSSTANAALLSGFTWEGLSATFEG